MMCYKDQSSSEKTGELRAAPLGDSKPAPIPLNQTNPSALHKQAAFQDRGEVTQMFPTKFPKGLPCWEKMIPFKVRILPIL